MTVARLLLYAGALVAIGSGSVAFLDPEWKAGARSVHALRAPLTLARAGAAALVTAPLLLLVLQLRALEMTVAEIPALLVGTGWGAGWSQLMGACLAGGVALLLPVGRMTSLLRLLASLGVAAAMGGLGHAAADERWPLAARLLDAIHVAAMGAWIGGLVVTMLITRSPAFALGDAAWRTFSRTATILAPVTVLTGIGSGVRMLGGTATGAILASDYGRLLLLKTVLVMAVLVIGARQRARIADGRQPERDRVLTEVAVAVAVLAVTALFTGMEPPGE